VTNRNSRRRSLDIAIERWPLKAAFHITGHTFTELEVVVVSIFEDGCIGRGEAAGVYYRNDRVHSMAEQIESVRTAIEAGTDRHGLRRLLPAGGARNAADCALWELESQIAGVPVWQLAGLNTPQPLLTTYTLGADHPLRMVEAAHAYRDACALKLKLTGEPINADRVREVRAARPDVCLAIDANQGMTRASLEQLMPVLVDANVTLIEQPPRIGEAAELENVDSPIPIAADESVQDSADVAGLVDRFDVVNIKLDKCGGLTEALDMARTARSVGLAVMVGNMGGTSLAMAPGFVLGQLCDIVDLDGPLALAGDRAPSVVYAKGSIACPQNVWGAGSVRRSLSMQGTRE
jgi:L-Ala-D/L-Glu epimerase